MIREGAGAGGTVVGILEHARIPMQVDGGFGDLLTDPEQWAGRLDLATQASTTQQDLAATLSDYARHHTTSGV